MTLSQVTSIITRRQPTRFIEVGDQVEYGRYVGYVVSWTRQPEWCAYEWNIRIWVPALARDVVQPLHEVLLIEAA